MLSVVIPLHNLGYKGDYCLKRCLDSILAQTYNDYEVLLMENGSTDDTIKIAEEYCKKDNRFKLHILDTIGVSNARNKGIELAKGEYITFIDGDDFCEKEMLEACVKHMDEDKLDMFVFAYNQYYLEKNTKEFIALNIQDGVTSLKENPSILAYTPNAAWNKMYRVDLFKDHNITYPFGYRHQDLGTTPKLIYYAKRIGYANKAYYNYLIDRPNNITRQVDEKIYHILAMAKEVVNFYQEVGYFDEVKEELNYLITINLINSLVKAMTLKDRKFVFAFIDDVFDFREQYFPHNCVKYNPLERKSHALYLHRNLCKAYYLYQRKVH